MIKQEEKKQSENLLEIAADWPNLYFGNIIDGFFRSKNGKIIYLNVPVDVSLERMKEREYPTPKSTIEKQKPFDQFFEIAQRRKIPMIEISGTLPKKEVFQTAKDFLNPSATKPKQKPSIALG